MGAVKYILYPCKCNEKKNGKLWQIHHQISKLQCPSCWRVYYNLQLSNQREHTHSIGREGRFSLRGWTGDCTLFIPWEFFGLVLKRVLSFILLFLQCRTFMDCPLYVGYCAMSCSLVYKEIVFLRGKPALKTYKLSNSLVSMWDCFQDLSRYQICRCSSPWYKNDIIFEYSYAHPPTYTSNNL